MEKEVTQEERAKADALSQEKMGLVDELQRQLVSVTLSLSSLSLSNLLALSLSCARLNNTNAPAVRSLLFFVIISKSYRCLLSRMSVQVAGEG